VLNISAERKNIQSWRVEKGQVCFIL